MVRIYIASHPTDAHFVKGLLETQNIECCVRGETLFSVRGEVPITEETAPSVWVYDTSRLAEAEAVVADYEGGLERKTKSSTWVCDSCGEELEDQFTSCWNCGAARKP